MSARPSRPAVLGVDGIRGGWVAAELASAGSVTWVVSPEVAPVLARAPDPAAVVAIDIPIGLTDGPPRECDRQARRRLPGRASSVFPAPTRATAQDRRDGVEHAEAVRRARQRGHPAPSLQAWNITDKIVEVEDALATAAARVVECHPEVTFARLAGRVLDRKSTVAGVAQRIRALAGHVDVLAALEHLPAGVGMDDALDALACAWSAERVQSGRAEALGDPEQADRTGRPLLIRV